MDRSDLKNMNKNEVIVVNRYNHTAGSIRWADLSRTPRVKQEVSNGRTKLEFSAEDWRLPFLFESSSGFLGCRLESSKRIEASSGSFHLAQLDASPLTLGRTWKLRSGDQTRMAQKLIEVDDGVFELFIRHSMRVQRAIANNSLNYIEDAILVLCSTIDSFGNFLLHKKPSSSFGHNDIQKMVARKIIHYEAAQAYKDARNLIAHGNLGKLECPDKIYQYALVLSNYYPMIAFMAIGFKPEESWSFESRFIPKFARLVPRIE